MTAFISHMLCIKVYISVCMKINAILVRKLSIPYLYCISSSL